MAGADAVRWEPWGEDAFARARAEGKRVLLSISASWCHWCHVMDEESFAHPEVIRRLTEEFIPVRIDSDKRPDLNARYNMGGWPTVAILDAEGELLAGESYLPTSQFLGFLASAVSSPKARSRPPASVPSAAPPLEASLVATVASWLERAYDRTFGGFGLAPKFPQPWAVEFALHRHAQTGDRAWLAMATHTLEAMRNSELYDLAEGGFFRYATSDDWDHPHYEKLLEMNAQLLMLYLRAYRITGDPAYRATARGLVDYLLTVLAVDGASWFGGSQSADRDYYALSQEERFEVDAPPVDRTCYTDRNAMAASALLLAGGLLDQPELRQRGGDLIEFLWRARRRSDGGMAHCDDGALEGYLSDQVWMATALLDTAEWTGHPDALDRATMLLSAMERQLWDQEQGGYWDLPIRPGAEGLLRVRLKPLAENAVAAMALTRLFHVTGEARYREQAERTLCALAPIVAGYKHHAAPFGVALMRLLDPPDLVAVVGRPADPRWQVLLAAAHRLPSTWLIVLPLDAGQDPNRLRARGYPPADAPLAYRCHGTRCLPPITEPHELTNAAW
jgi:uncharacterized protein YyaL (SSP411 family)